MSWMAAAIGGSALLGYMGSREQADAMQDPATRTTTESVAPEWSTQQLPYIFGDNAWQSPMPQMNAEALNYGQALMGGFNPAYGPQQPMGFDELLAQISGTPQAAKTEGGGWFQDPNSTVYNPQGNAGGVEGLLGYGAGTPPPLFDNNPYFAGQGVRDPENMMQGPGMPQIDENAAALAAAQPAPAPPPQVQQAPPPPPPDVQYWQDSPRAQAMLFGGPEGTSMGGLNPNAVDPWGQMSRTPGGGPALNDQLMGLDMGLNPTADQQEQARRNAMQILAQSGMNPGAYF